MKNEFDKVIVTDHSKEADLTTDGNNIDMSDCGDSNLERFVVKKTFFITNQAMLC